MSRETTSELLRPFYNISGDELKLDTSFVKTRKFRNRHGFTQYSVLLSLIAERYNYYQLNKKLIKAMAEYCKEKGIQFMLVTIDTDAYIPEVEKSCKTIDPTFDANFLEDDLKDYATSLNVEYLGLQRLFRQTFENTGVTLHWGHWNYEGHKVVAHALADKLNSIIGTSQEW